MDEPNNPIEFLDLSATGTWQKSLIDLCAGDPAMKRAVAVFLETTLILGGLERATLQPDHVAVRELAARLPPEVAELESVRQRMTELCGLVIERRDYRTDCRAVLDALSIATWTALHGPHFAAIYEVLRNRSGTGHNGGIAQFVAILEGASTLASDEQARFDNAVVWRLRHPVTVTAVPVAIDDDQLDSDIVTADLTADPLLETDPGDGAALLGMWPVVLDFPAEVDERADTERLSAMADVSPDTAIAAPADDLAAGRALELVARLTDQVRRLQLGILGACLAALLLVFGFGAMAVQEGNRADRALVASRAASDRERSALTQLKSAEHLATMESWVRVVFADDSWEIWHLPVHTMIRGQYATVFLEYGDTP